jgi:hypothetical protein
MVSFRSKSALNYGLDGKAFLSVTHAPRNFPTILERGRNIWCDSPRGAVGLRGGAENKDGREPTENVAKTNDKGSCVSPVHVGRPGDAEELLTQSTSVLMMADLSRSRLLSSSVRSYPAPPPQLGPKPPKVPIAPPPNPENGSVIPSPKSEKGSRMLVRGVKVVSAIFAGSGELQWSKGDEGSFLAGRMMARGKQGASG